MPIQRYKTYIRPCIHKYIPPQGWGVSFVLKVASIPIFVKFELTLRFYIRYYMLYHVFAIFEDLYLQD